MMKLYSEPVRYCDDCSNFVVTINDYGRKYYICIKKERLLPQPKREGNSFIVRYKAIIPDWCPLPDIEAD